MRKMVVILLATLTFWATPWSLPARNFPPLSPAPAATQLPQPSLRVLPNGMKVVALERSRLPLATLEVAVMAGSREDPPELPGTAQFLASMLGEGTRHRSAMQIAAAIEDAGGTIDTEADWDDSYAEIDIPSNHAQQALRLLASIMIRPAFRPNEMELTRRQTLSALDVMRQDPRYLADTVFAEVALRGTPYGHPPAGTAESIRRISASDLARFCARYYRPANAALIVVGPLPPAKVFSWAQEYFGNWKDGKAPSFPRAATLPPMPPRQVIAVDDPNAAQSVIRLGNRIVGRSDPAYDALTVANQVLGGPAENLLFSALRSRRGLVYGASSVLECYRNAGMWEAKTSTRTKDTARAVRLALEQMKRLRGDAVKGWDLQTVQNYLLGHMALRFVTNHQIVRRVLELLVYNLPLNYWSQFPQRVSSLTVSQIRAAADRYLDPENTIIVVVGNIEAFKRRLEQFGPTRVIPLADVDLASGTIERRDATAIQNR